MQTIEKSGVAILVSDKIQNKVTRDKEGHYTMIKESVQQEELTITHTYASNIGAPKYVQQILTIKEENRRLQHTPHSKGQINQTRK